MSSCSSTVSTKCSLQEGSTRMWTDCPVVNDISVHYRKAQQECGQIVPLLMILVFITGRLNKNVDRLSRC